MLFATITAVIMLAVIIILVLVFDLCTIINLFKQFFSCAVNNTDKHSRRQ